MTMKLSPHPGIIPPCPPEPGLESTAADIFNHGWNQKTEEDRKQKLMLLNPLRPPYQKKRSRAIHRLVRAKQQALLPESPCCCQAISVLQQPTHHRIYQEIKQSFTSCHLQATPDVKVIQYLSYYDLNSAIYSQQRAQPRIAGLKQVL